MPKSVRGGHRPTGWTTDDEIMVFIGQVLERCYSKTFVYDAIPEVREVADFLMTHATQEDLNTIVDIYTRWTSRILNITDILNHYRKDIRDRMINDQDNKRKYMFSNYTKGIIKQLDELFLPQVDSLYKLESKNVNDFLEDNKEDIKGIIKEPARSFLLAFYGWTDEKKIEKIKELYQKNIEDNIRYYKREAYENIFYDEDIFNKLEMETRPRGPPPPNGIIETEAMFYAAQIYKITAQNKEISEDERKAKLYMLMQRFKSLAMSTFVWHSEWKQRREFFARNIDKLCEHLSDQEVVDALDPELRYQPLTRFTSFPILFALMLTYRIEIDSSSKTYEGMTPLSYAIVKDDKTSINVLLEAGADPNGIDKQTVTPLGNIILYNRGLSIFELLLNFGADVTAKSKVMINKREVIEISPLALAVFMDNIDITKLIIDKHGSDVAMVEDAVKTCNKLTVLPNLFSKIVGSDSHKILLKRYESIKYIESQERKAQEREQRKAQMMPKPPSSVFLRNVFRRKNTLTFTGLDAPLLGDYKESVEQQPSGEVTYVIHKPAEPRTRATPAASSSRGSRVTETVRQPEQVQLLPGQVEDDVDDILGLPSPPKKTPFTPHRNPYRQLVEAGGGKRKVSFVINKKKVTRTVQVVKGKEVVKYNGKFLQTKHLKTL